MLTHCRLEQYAATFEEEGYDDLQYLLGLSKPRLMGIAKELSMKPGHALKWTELLPSFRYQP